eukprot:TRINITY_DN18279_c0_g1_i1.p1 TRINITY_DN18279_c0_g1~~TRINITY_DN18279_c0_g1_i1.p1  ORF type:complete len:101 (+),score=9.49 TRINITY_DN18279_c0_g1_i1:150-452(+)
MSCSTTDTPRKAQTLRLVRFRSSRCWFFMYPKVGRSCRGTVTILVYRVDVLLEEASLRLVRFGSSRCRCFIYPGSATILDYRVDVLHDESSNQSLDEVQA